MPAIPFPSSSVPGQKPGEGSGRLINAICDVDAGEKFWRPLPGADVFCDLSETNPRGMIVVDGVLYAAHMNGIKKITPSGSVSQISGVLTGSNPVTWAQNNKSPTRDVVIVTENGCYSVSSISITSFADTDLPKPNSVSALDGFFIFTTSGGQIWASGLNDVTVNALSYTNAQADPDGLVRGTSAGGQFFAWGQTSCEVYQNAGTSPFPLRRVSVIKTGLIGPWAIAGFQEGWNGDQVFIGSDGAVRRLRGYDTEIISTRDVERSIESVADKTKIYATCYVFEGKQIVSFSSDAWTWEYNLKTGFWHERKSQGLDRWIGSQSAYFNDKWVIGNCNGTNLLQINNGSFDEDGKDIPVIIESAPIKEFPLRTFIARAMFDFTTGTAPISGNQEEIDPVVAISWSMNGGGIWGNEIQKSLGKIGEISKSIRINRIGLSTHHGVRFRLSSTANVYRTLRGGYCDKADRGAA